MRSLRVSRAAVLALGRPGAPGAAWPAGRGAPTSATRTPSRAALREDVERRRGNVLEHLAAAPGSMPGYRPTPPAYLPF